MSTATLRNQVAQLRRELESRDPDRRKRTTSETRDEFRRVIREHVATNPLLVGEILDIFVETHPPMTEEEGRAILIGLFRGQPGEADVVAAFAAFDLEMENHG